MAVDEGARDAYLTTLRNKLEALRGEREKLRARLVAAQLEDAAQASLPPEQQVILRDAGLLDRDDVTLIQAERQKLVEQIQAVAALIQSVRSLV